jgi:hypothetical protein
VCHHTEPLVEMGSGELDFLVGLALNVILQVATSQVARITGVSHCVTK